jgi:hypothetical protein
MWLSRVALAVGLALLLGGLCVGYGTLQPDPAEHRYPGNDALAAGHLVTGDRVVLSGTVRAVTADRVALDLKHGESRVSLRGFDREVGRGDDVWLYGVVRSDGSVAVERAVVRDPWEIAYLYAVSLVGALLTLGRALRTWRVDRDRYRFVPREGRDG